MVRKDYLLRVIEQFAAFLEKILYHKQAGDYAGAAQQIDATVTTLLGLDPELLYAMGADQILSTVIGDTKFDVDICCVVAELFNQKAELARVEDSGTTYIEYLKKSFLLYAEAISHGADNTVYRDRILAIVNTLRLYELPDTFKLKFMWYYELCGLFAKAEDVLLAIGNLPRREVEEGYLHFSKLAESTMEPK